jgi:APA family basic amino acid/polyamine antiporter
MSSQIFRRKPIAHALKETDQGVTLRRVLGPVQLTSLGIGGIIGAGIFVTTGRVAALDAGPAVMVSYLVAAVACLLAALCYSEFASRAPVTGSAYSYAYITLGELAAWLIGWDLVLEYSMSCATVAAAWSEYFNEFLYATCGIRIPQQLCSDPFSKPGAWFNLPAVVIMGLATCVLLRGIRESALVNMLLVIAKVFVVLFVIVVGFRFIAPENWITIPVEQRVLKETADSWGILGLLGADRLLQSFDSATRSSFMPYGISGVMFGASIVFFAFIGFDSISAYAEETKRPQRDIPLSTLGSLFVCTALYVAVSAVITGMQPYPQIDTEAAIAAAFTERAEAIQSHFLRFSSALIALGALAGMTSVILITFLGQTRIFLAMARDGLLPQQVFSYVHPKYRTPSRSTLLTGVLVALVAAFTPITKLEEMVNIGTLLAFAIVCAAVLVLRSKDPATTRGFRVPWVNIVAPCGVLVNVILMLFLPVSSWCRLLIWMLIGVLIYVGYGSQHSGMRHFEAE